MGKKKCCHCSYFLYGFNHNAKGKDIELSKLSFFLYIIPAYKLLFNILKKTIRFRHIFFVLLVFYIHNIFKNKKKKIMIHLQLIKNFTFILHYTTLILHV